MSVKQNSGRNTFSRRSAPGATGKTLLIVTEGKRTEPDYLTGLRNHLKLYAADIKIIPADGTDPLSIVNYAIRLLEERKRAAKRGCTVPYDAVWAVFDTERVDTNPKLNDAMQKARAHNINIAISNPCFEFWLLLHDEYTTAPFVKCENVIRRIKERYIADYDKTNIPVIHYIPAKVPQAIINAAKCRQHHHDAGVKGNPSTDVDKLVREMNDATRPHFRIEL